MNLDLTVQAAWWFLPLVTPIAIFVAWSDMAYMKIPNKAVLALMLVFLVVGLVALPWAVYPWRLVHFVVVLVVGFLMNAVGLLGAGDAKFAAAMAPFIALPDITPFLYILAPVVLAAFITHRLVRRMAVIRARFPDWESWERRDFPMGLALGPSLVFYLLAGVFWGS
ncbi:MAG: hypothetical protein GY945_03280 [Rhodobacteraceae bacterium]|nr:hypothetical protein [Paracoccaceae bacterium]